VNKEQMRPFVRMAVKWGLAAGGLGGVGMLMMDNPAAVDSMPAIFGGAEPVAEAAVESALAEVIVDAIMDGGGWLVSGLWDVVTWPFDRLVGLF